MEQKKRENALVKKMLETEERMQALEKAVEVQVSDRHIYKARGNTAMPTILCPC